MLPNSSKELVKKRYIRHFIQYSFDDLFNEGSSIHGSNIPAKSYKNPNCKTPSLTYEKITFPQ